MKKLTIIVMLLSLGAAAFARPGTARDLQYYWHLEKVGYTTWEAGYFFGFVIGIAKVLDTSHVIDIPLGLQMGKIVARMGYYLEAHSELWDKLDYLFVIDMLKDFYPVKK